MERKSYLVGYTIFSKYWGGGCKTFYKHFEKLEHAIKFCENPNFKNNCMLYESREIKDAKQEIERKRT